MKGLILIAELEVEKEPEMHRSDELQSPDVCHMSGQNSSWDLFFHYRASGEQHAVLRQIQAAGSNGLNEVKSCYVSRTDFAQRPMRTLRDHVEGATSHSSLCAASPDRTVGGAEHSVPAPKTGSVYDCGVVRLIVKTEETVRS